MAVRRHRLEITLVALGAAAFGCGASSVEHLGTGYLVLPDGGGQVLSADLSCGDAGVECSGSTHCFQGACRPSNIQHVVIVVEENHTFDSYFGSYCQAPTGSNPSCTQGRGCCEAAPATTPEGTGPELLDDANNQGSDRNHAQACEQEQVDQGRMDHFTRGPDHHDSLCSPACSTQHNFAVANGLGQGEVAPYWALADQFALADRYFQPIEGSSSSNDMYLAVAHAQFIDDTDVPNSIGSGCDDPTGMNICGVDGQATQYSGRPTIVDLLRAAGHSFGVYADGYADAVAAGYGACPSVPDDCPYDSVLDPVDARSCLYDPSDIPFQYYAQLTDDPAIFKDFSSLSSDIAAGALPDVSFVKGRSYRNEHPGVSTISAGVSFSFSVIDAIASSPYQSNTLVLVLWDEGGGFFDHIPPPELADPPAESVDTDDQGQPVIHGTRVPLLVLGPFARPGTISHATLDHTSIVRFLEYNFVGPVGQLGHADARVNNLGSLLDPSTTGPIVPVD